MEVTITKQTSLKKSYSVGLVAETTYKMKAPNRYLQVSTMKSHKGSPYTTFQSVTINDEGVVSFIIFKDFNKRTPLYTEVKRCTAKSISECHEKSIANIESILEEAEKFYETESELVEG